MCGLAAFVGLFVVQAGYFHIELLAPVCRYDDPNVTAFIDDVWYYVAATFGRFAPYIARRLCNLPSVGKFHHAVFPLFDEVVLLVIESDGGIGYCVQCVFVYTSSFISLEYVSSYADFPIVSWLIECDDLTGQGVDHLVFDGICGAF